MSSVTDATTTFQESTNTVEVDRFPAVVWQSPANSALRISPVSNVTTLGRDSACGVSLEGAAVSRNHAEIRKEGPIYSLRDLKSRNGTYINGARVEHSVLHFGDVIRIGEWVGIFSLATREASQFRELAPGLMGGSAFHASLQGVERAAKAGLSIAISGETGVGKELIARAAHYWSGRQGRFCALNCAAIPENLFESELFGYRKGAFTGAERAALGYFRTAHGGTLFLDEIGELPHSLQAKLLRVLQERTVVPLGEQLPVAIDVQVVCASQGTLQALSQAGQLRLDLATRVSGLTVEVLPLRERREEIVPLFRHVLERFGAACTVVLEPKLVECLLLYEWPGNVRELEQAARQMQALHGEERVLTRYFLPKAVQQAVPEDQAAKADAPEAPQDFGTRTRRVQDQKRLAAALKETNGNVTEAAKLLGCSRQRAYRLMSGKASPEFLAGKESEGEGE